MPVNIQSVDHKTDHAAQQSLDVRVCYPVATGAATDKRQVSTARRKRNRESLSVIRNVSVIIVAAVRRLSYGAPL